MKSIVIRDIIFALLLACLTVTEGYAAAGKFNFVIGDVRVVSASGERKAARGGEVEANDTIISGKNSMAQLRLSDGAFIALRADTELRIDKYQYDSKAPAANDTVLSLAKGTMRAFTGAIASLNKERFKMKTATATIGIRGSGNVLNFSPVGNLTLNHTILGSHVVTTFDPSGAMRTLVSMPGQTVLINPTGVMRFVPTPAFILEAVTATRKPEPDQPQSAGKSNQPNQPAENNKQAQGAGAEPQPGNGNAPQSPAQGGDAPPQGGPGAPPGGAMGAAPFVEGAPLPGTGAPGMEAPGMAPGMYGAPAMDPAMVPGGMAPGMYGGPAVDPTLAGGGMAPGMYGAAPMPATTPGMYGTPAMMAGGMTPGMYGAAPTYGAGYTAPTYGAGYTAPTYGAGYTAPTYGAGYTAPTYGAGYTAPTYGAGYTAPTYGAGYTAPTYGAGYTAPTYGAGYTAPTYGASYTPPTYVAPTYIAPIYTANPYAWAYDANGNLLSGYTLVNGVPTLSTAASGVGCSGAGAGSISGTLYCDGTTWIQPAVDQPCKATGIVVGAFTCSGGIWTSSAAVWGGACSGAGNVSGTLYCNGATWVTPTIGTACIGTGSAGGFTCSGGIWMSSTTTAVSGGTAVWGGACTGAGSVSGTLYCDGTMWVTPTIGTACTGTGSAGGFTCSGGIWISGTTSAAVSGGACATTGSISGTLYCDGTTWIQPAVNQACAATGIVVGTFTCSGGVWTSSTAAVWGGACTGAGSVSGSLYCDGAKWITPTIGSACVGTGTAGGFTCSAGVWIASTVTVVSGGACTGAGSVSGGFYCNGSTWATPATVTATVVAGGACTAGSVSGIYYCNVSTWATPAVGGACGLVAGTVVGSFECNGTNWIAATYATPAFLAPPTAGMMYDAFGALVTIPAGGYRNILYSYATVGNTPAMEFARDNTVVAAGSPTTTFAAPSTNGTATTSTNVANFTVGTSLVDFGYDSVSGMSWGRWQGSWLATGANPVTATTTNNLHWFATSVQTQPVTLPVTGTWNYTLVGKTNPTDNAGVVGTLNSATFFANFTAQTVDVGINVSMPASPANNALPVTLNANAVAVPILAGGNFKTATPTVTCTAGTCGAVSGAIGGHFSAPNGAGVGVGYGLNNGTQTINGVAVFRH